MKNLLLITTVFLLTTLSVSAQITITSDDAPSVGMTFIQANDTMPSLSITQGNSGANQIWNLSALNPIFYDTMAFILPSSTPYAAQFPGTNLSVKTRYNGQPLFYYINKDNSGVYAKGLYGNVSTALNQSIILHFIPSTSMMRTPSSYQSNYVENYHFEIKAKAPASITFADSIKVHSWISATSNIDGWGTVTTPSGTYNSIRQYVREINTDTIWVHAMFVGWFQYATAKDTNDTYKWMANGIGITVAEMKMNLHQNKTKSVLWYVPQQATTSTVSGTLLYNNTAFSPIGSATVNLMSGTTQVATTTTNLNGAFTFTNVADGDYTISSSTAKLWGGVTATDALKMKRHISGLELLVEPIRLNAADVNFSSTINSTDVLKVQRRIAGLDASFARPDWLFEKQTVGGTSITVSGSNVNVSLFGICAGDVNGSNIPAK